jgi:hydroxymethylglutaryl-CoA synthase
MAGLSHLALRVPRPRVPLADWCGWTGASTEKIRAVVGDAFRVPAAHEDVYTLAAGAALELLDAPGVDPERVGLLLLATESSTDNAVGGPTVRGLVDAGLRARGRAPLPRAIETFELKQACLSGLNGLLAAARFVTLEPDKTAVVVAADIAEYARGSSGEPTQGAGAVAMLVEAEPRLLALDPRRVGRASADRGFDFRKPARTAARQEGPPEARPIDVPRFAGPYSTHCYADAVDAAVSDLAQRTARDLPGLLEAAPAILLHRPFEKMPQTALARIWTRGQLESGAAARLAEEADMSLADAEAELAQPPDLEAFARAQGVDRDPTPALSELVRAVMRTPRFRAFFEPRCGLGRGVMRELGNLYAAALPAWIGAALEDAARLDRAFDGRLLLLGYGSGDAALAAEAELVPGWREAAKGLGFARALEGAVDLGRETYEAAHDRRRPVWLEPRGEPALIGVGDGEGLGFDDRGVPRYAFVVPA